MTLAADLQSTSQEDPVFRQAMADLHTGEWQRAIASFETLAERYPNDRAVARGLDEARFKAGLDAQVKIRPKQWVFPYAGRLLRLALIAAVLVLVVVGVLNVRQRMAAALAAAETERHHAELLAAGNNLLAAGDFDGAEARFNDLLALAPDHEGATMGLASVKTARELLARYNEAIALQEGGDCSAALVAFGELSLRKTNYRDVNERVVQCTRSLDIGTMLKDADVLYRVGLLEWAVDLYTQARAQGARMLPEGGTIDGRLARLHLKLGRQLLEQEAVTPEQLRQARDRFQTALQLDPTSPEASYEQRLLRQYLDGQAALGRQQWGSAVTTLRAVYDERPTYLNGAGVPPLYEAYLGLGDSHRSAGDCALAYEQYRKAAELPVSDTTAALARQDEVIACITPTPTITNTPLPTAPPPPSATPTPTPTPRPLETFRNRIVFKSEQPEQPGFWSMDSTGENRDYIGPLDDSALQRQFDELLIRYRQAPDGLRYVYVDKLDGRAQIFVATSDSAWQPRALTRLTGIAYDPTWSPDGSLVAFVTQENESDDIWVIRPDSSGQEALMRNDWEWDKHPSWSPDNTRIVFWSNRYGMNQIYIMDATGQNVRNISNVPWNEFDPIWIR